MRYTVKTNFYLGLFAAITALISASGTFYQIINNSEISQCEYIEREITKLTSLKSELESKLTFVKKSENEKKFKMETDLMITKRDLEKYLNKKTNLKCD